MNREEVIKLAKQSGLFVELVLERDLDWLERFAALVASAERDRMCEQFNLSKELAHEKAKSNEAN